MSIREKYNIPVEDKVILYVGNISRNKNQVQMVRAYGLLPEDLRKQTWVLFCGNNHSGSHELEDLIASTPNSNHLVLCGGVDKAEMPFYYKEADGVALLSIAEGFGLSLIEGMHYGLPCVMFNDMDAFEDIFYKEAVVGVVERSDDKVAVALEELVTRPWNSNEIKSFSEKFDSQEMAKRYKEVYELL